MTEVPPAEPNVNFFFPGTEVELLNRGTVLVFSGHIVDLGSIVEHSLCSVNSVDLVAWEHFLHWLVVSAAAFHTKENVHSLLLETRVIVSEQDFLNHASSLGPLGFVNMVVDARVEHSGLPCGLLEHIDSLGIVRFVLLSSEPRKGVPNLTEADIAELDLSSSLSMRKLESVELVLFLSEFGVELSWVNCPFFDSFL